nr:hypothetical protein [Bdellovibrionales bacterium]
VYKTKDRGMALQSQGWRTYLSPLGEVSLPLFQKISALPAHEMQTLNQKTGRDANELKDYFTRRYSVDLSDAAAVEILREMYADSNVEFAYFEPRFEDAVWQKPSGVAPVISSQAGGLENFESRQFHLNPAPEGVDARYGWTIPGGTGQGIRIIDVETGWFTHHLEFGAAFYDNGKNGQRDHGTAVWGAVAAKNDGRGIVGIAYDVAWGIAGNGADAGLDNYATAIAAVIENAVLNL